jgi:hypothetical protein
MRIIAKNHDYYDCIQPYDTDRSVTWVRAEKEMLIPRSQIVLSIEDRWNPTVSPIWGNSCFAGDISMDENIIGFCGKLYLVLILRKIGM